MNDSTQQPPEQARPRTAGVIGLSEMGGFEHFVILKDGFNGRNEFVQMDFRPLNKETEGAGLAISFSTDIMEERGDYLPITLDKEETGALINYLTRVYEAL